jgi:hypothetical protein
MRRAILVTVRVVTIVVAAFALAGCFENTKQDLAACKLKALEVYPSKMKSSEYEEEQAYYVQICMEATGYQVRPLKGCGTATNKWINDGCYSRGG